jgi:hypothetical protein
MREPSAGAHTDRNEVEPTVTEQRRGGDRSVT